MSVKIDIYSQPLEIKQNQSRREAEAKASALMIQNVFGSEAVLNHDLEGRPVIDVEGFNGSISISHCINRCVLAVTQAQDVSIGVDIETWREQLIRIAPKFMLSDEIEAYTAPALLLLAWTTKEAVYKAARTPGLALKEISLPIPAPTTDKFTAKAREMTFEITSCVLTDDYATTTASTTISQD